MKKFITTYFSQGHERTILAKKNIAGTFFLKGLSILISLILVPLTISYINPTEFGIWVTISSFLTWFAFFDIGFGSGLKNKLGLALAKKDYELARIYVSTTYFILIIISFMLLMIFVFANFFLDWSKILNAPLSLKDELQKLIIIIFAIFSIQFVLQLINVIIAASQHVFISSLIGLLGNLVTLIIIFILNKTTDGSLYFLGLAVSLSPIFVFTIFTFFLYRGKYKALSPTYKLIRPKYARELMGLGIKFFIIQLGLILFYNMDNLIISNVISPVAVTSYAVAFKYFSIITMLSSIVMAPMWPAFTEAQAKGDFEWIKLTINRLLKFCVIIFIVGVLMLIFSESAYKIWVGPDIIISFKLSIILLLFTVVNAYRTIFCYYLNGIGKINMQLYEILGAGLLNIPLGIYMGKIWGIEGVVGATTILCIVCGIIETVQYKMLVNNKAKGIWNR